MKVSIHSGLDWKLVGRVSFYKPEPARGPSEVLYLFEELDGRNKFLELEFGALESLYPLRARLESEGEVERRARLPR